MDSSLLRATEIVFPYGKPPAGVDVVWRCVAQRYSVVIDPDRELYGVSDPRIEMHWANVWRRTKRGVYVDGCITFPESKRSKWRNTPEAALASLVERRRRQVSILTTQLRRAEQELSLAQSATLAAASDKKDAA